MAFFSQDWRRVCNVGASVVVGGAISPRVGVDADESVTLVPLTVWGTPSWICTVRNAIHNPFVGFNERRPRRGMPQRGRFTLQGAHLRSHDSYGIRFRSLLRRMNIPSAPLLTTMMPLSKYG